MTWSICHLECRISVQQRRFVIGTSIHLLICLILEDRSEAQWRFLEVGRMKKLLHLLIYCAKYTIVIVE